MNSPNLINVQHAATQLMQQIHSNLPECDPSKVTDLIYLLNIAYKNGGSVPDVGNFARATIDVLTSSTDYVITNAEAVANLTLLQDLD